MDEADLYDDILAGTLSPSRLVTYVEALLEVGVHRRVLRLPEVSGCPPLQAVREAAGRLLNSDAGLRDAVGSAPLVFQRRSLKFDTWIDMVAIGERPIADGERLRAMPVAALEAGEVLSDGEVDGEAAESESRRRRGSDRRRHHKRRHRSGSADSERRRRHRHRRRHRRRRERRSTSPGSQSAASGGSEEGAEERRSSKRRRSGRKERHRHSHRRRRRHSTRSRSRSQSRDRSASSDSHSSRSRSGSTRRRRSGSSSGSDDRRRSVGSSRHRRYSSSPEPTSSKPRVPPPRTVSAQAWQHMDPEFAEQLRLYELERARREGKQEFCDDLSGLADISDDELSCSRSPSPDESDRFGRTERRGKEKEEDKTKDMSDLGLRVLDRLKKLREQLGGADGASGSTNGKTEKEDAERRDEDETEVEARGMCRP